MSVASSQNGEELTILGGVVRREDILPPTEWADKKNRPTCCDCGSKFNNFFRRRHHCRLCGELFCKNCIVQKVLQVLGHDKSYVKICRSCALEDTTTICSSASSSARCVDPTENFAPHWKVFAKDLMAKPSSGLCLDVERYSTTPEQLKDNMLIPRSNEVDRLAILRSYNIAYKTRDDILDGLCGMSAAMLHCPMSMLGFMEEHTQWIKASIGIELTTLSRADSMCAEVVSSRKPLVVLDTLIDSRFRHSTLVTEYAVRFYAAVPIKNSNGWVIGSLAVMDYEPRSECDVKHLLELAEAAVNNLRAVKPKVRRRTESYDATYELPRSQVRLLDTDFSLSMDENAVASPIETLTDSSRGGLSEAMLMDLLTQSTKTQDSLAQQQGYLVSALDDHSEKIDMLTLAISRMESKMQTTT